MNSRPKTLSASSDQASRKLIERISNGSVGPDEQTMFVNRVVTDLPFRALAQSMLDEYKSKSDHVGPSTSRACCLARPGRSFASRAQNLTAAMGPIAEESNNNNIRNGEEELNWAVRGPRREKNARAGMMGIEEDRRATETYDRLGRGLKTQVGSGMGEVDNWAVRGQRRETNRRVR